MTKYDVIIKNWKTGEVTSERHGVSAEELAKIEADHHAHGHPFCDVETTEVISLGYAIEKKNPEGFPRAFVVTWDGVEVATFSYRDSADYYVERDVMNRRIPA